MYGIKQKLALGVFIVYLTVLLFFRFAGASIRDTLSYPVDVLYMFYYESDMGTSLYTVPQDCIYYEEMTGDAFVYILSKSNLWGDDGYYIEKMPVSVTPVENGFVFLGAFGTNQNVPIILTQVTADMHQKRAVIADTIEFTEEGVSDREEKK